MSRTYRRLPTSTGRSVKMYGHSFTFEDASLSRERLSQMFKAVKNSPKMRTVSIDYALMNPDWDKAAYIEHLHHEMFRNGSCRRQRINGTRLSKQLDRQQRRLKLRDELRRMLVMGEE